MIFYADRKTVARFVNDMRQNLGPNFASITITQQGRFAVCYVRNVIDTSSAATAETLTRIYWSELTTTYFKNTPDG